MRAPPQPTEGATTITAQVGQRIRTARRSIGATQSVFGQLLQPPVSHAAISCLEIGKTQIDVELLAQIAALTHLPLRYFYEGLPTDSLEERVVRLEGQVAELVLAVRDARGYPPPSRVAAYPGRDDANWP